MLLSPNEIEELKDESRRIEGLGVVVVLLVAVAAEVAVEFGLANETAVSGWFCFCFFLVLDIFLVLRLLGRSNKTIMKRKKVKGKFLFSLCIIFVLHDNVFLPCVLLPLLLIINKLKFLACNLKLFGKVFELYWWKVGWAL